MATFLARVLPAATVLLLGSLSDVSAQDTTASGVESDAGYVCKRYSKMIDGDLPEIRCNTSLFLQQRAPRGPFRPPSTHLDEYGDEGDDSTFAYFLVTGEVNGKMKGKCVGYEVGMWPRMRTTHDTEDSCGTTAECLDPNRAINWIHGADTNTGQEHVGIDQGCVPFVSLASCTETCHEFEDTEEEITEALEELGEEGIHILEFLYHFAIMIYFCLGLALVCEDFFVASLEIIIEKLKLPPDVAGATFMAAGSSAPELFVAAVSVFMVTTGHMCVISSPEEPGHPVFATPPETDYIATELEQFIVQSPHNCENGAGAFQSVAIDEGIGVGAVVGSTMFNTMCIIGGSAIVSGKITKLDWRIIMRDGSTYMAAVIALAIILNTGGEPDSLNPVVKGLDMRDAPILVFFGADEAGCSPITVKCEDDGGCTSGWSNGAAVDPADPTKTIHYDKGAEIAGQFCKPKVYEGPLGVVTGGEAGLLLFLYACYILLCAIFGTILDKVRTSPHDTQHEFAHSVPSAAQTHSRLPVYFDRCVLHTGSRTRSASLTWRRRPPRSTRRTSRPARASTALKRTRRTGSCKTSAPPCRVSSLARSCAATST